MAQLSITNVINVSATTAQPGINAFNTSNLALFTDDQPQAAVQTIAFGGTAASGNFTLTFGGHATSSIAWNATLATIQADIAAVTGNGSVTVTGSIAGGSIVLSQPGVLGPIPLAVVSANTLQTAGSVAVTVTPVTTNVGWSGGTLGYSLYLNPTQVGLDFGTASKTYQMANAIFSQQPNILAGGGELVIIPFVTCQQILTFSAAPASGSFAVTFGAGTSALINWNDTPAVIQGKLQAVAGLSQVQVTSTIASQIVTILMYGQYGASVGALGTTTNTLNASITVVGTTTVAGETWSTAITRTQSLVSYFGNMVNELADTIGSTDVLAAGSTIQALNYNLLGFVVSNNSTDLNSGQVLFQIAASSLTCLRGLYYGDTTTVGGIAGINALLFMGAYAGLALSTNFTGSNTTQTMHLKTLSGIAADPTLTQTLLTNAGLAGADTYPSLQGVAKVFCSGVNQFYDQVYNLAWFVTALQVAGFNYLATTNTKIPQTENGMDGLKTAYRQICQQAVTNQYCAPGTWTSSTTFGNQANFLQNVSQRGYYIYSSPISQQSQANRVARQAPLVQIALKQAGAIQSSSVIVNVNA